MLQNGNSAYILKIVENDSLLRLQMRAKIHLFIPTVFIISLVIEAFRISTNL